MLTKILLLPLLLAAVTLNAEQIILDQDDFEHIHFKRIRPNIVDISDNTIHFEVNKSASFLLLAFDEIRNIQHVSFEWRASGQLNKRNIEHENTRNGDDAWLRVGLIIEGQAADIPEPLLPRWMKQVRKTLRYTSNSMIYLIPGAKHEPGQTWQSPFNSDIDMVSVESISMGDEWKRVVHEFDLPLQTIGLWIMADGDNTASVFNSQLRSLVIQ